MTRSDDTHKSEASMTPEEMKNELRYLRAENAYPKTMQGHPLEKKCQELEKRRKSSRAWGTGTTSLTCQRPQGWSETRCTTSYRCRRLRTGMLMWDSSWPPSSMNTGDVIGTGGSIMSFRKGVLSPVAKRRENWCNSSAWGLLYAWRNAGLTGEIWDSLQKISFSDNSKRKLPVRNGW